MWLAGKKAWNDLLLYRVRCNTLISHLTNAGWSPFTRGPPTLGPSQLISAVSLPESTHHCRDLLLSQHSFYWPTEGTGRSQPGTAVCSKGLRPVCTVYSVSVTSNINWRLLWLGRVSRMSAVVVRRCWNGSLPVWTLSTFGSKLCASKKSGEEPCILWKHYNFVRELQSNSNRLILWSLIRRQTGQQLADPFKKHSFNDVIISLVTVFKFPELTMNW